MLVLGLALLALAMLSASIPDRAGAAVTSGALTQLTGGADCIGEEVETSEGNACETRVHQGTHDVFQVELSPDGLSAYSVAINGDLIEYSRDPANGALKTIGCITAGTDVCAPENVVEKVVEIGHPSAIAVSPDGRNVYVTGTEKHAVVEFERNTGSGLLTPMNGGKACISEEAVSECEVNKAIGLNEPYGITVSPDGENVYVTAVKGKALAELSRNTATGVLEPLSGHECIGGPGSGCPIETAIGMTEPIGVVVSPDGKNVYVAAGAGSAEGAVVVFEREGGGGLGLPANEKEDCVSESVAGCTHATALQGSEDLVVSPDGNNVYATSGPKNSLVELKRNASSGALEPLTANNECVTTETIAGCTKVTSVGLSRGVAISPRGEDVYVGSAGENGVAAFARGSEGALTQLSGGAECVTSNATGCGSDKLLGLEEARRLAISPDGTNLYVAGQKAGAIVELARTFTPTVTSVNLVSGTPSGGETVRIKGFGFSEDLHGVKVKFGGVEATTTVSSGTTILATSPAHAEGDVHVTVENEAGASSESVSDEFRYTDKPTILGVNAAIGNEAGGTAVTITGRELSGVTAVRFGSVSAESFAVDSSETITATAPPGKRGSVDVVVETPHGASNSGTADVFTYVDGTPTSASGLFLQGYCESLGYKSVTLQREAVGGPGFAYENWACVRQDGTETPIANTGPGPSMEEACADENPGHTVYAYASEPNSAFSWGCNAVTPPEENERVFIPPPPLPKIDSELVAPQPLLPTVPPPVLAKTGNVAPVKGQVSVELPGTKTFVSLASLTQIPFGTTIEASNGTVSVTTANPNGTTQTGQFFDGQFILTQGRNGLVVAKLSGGNFSVCPTARERAHRARVSSRAPGARAAASGKHVVRKLWANAHGKFSTEGNYAAGAVQGTEWLTEDLCEGTLIRVTRDKVAVTNLVNHKHVEVKTGHKYLAKAP